jgi:hypothetical protein
MASQTRDFFLLRCPIHIQFSTYAARVAKQREIRILLPRWSEKFSDLLLTNFSDHRGNKILISLCLATLPTEPEVESPVSIRFPSLLVILVCEAFLC